MKKFSDSLQYFVTVMGIFSVIVVVGLALYYQYIHHDAPCPLCFLQRVAFINIGLAFLMNLRYGMRVAHFAIAGLSALVGSFVSIRQVLMHITTPEGYGMKFLGIHLYTWSLLGFVLALLTCLLMLLIHSEDSENVPNENKQS